MYLNYSKCIIINVIYRNGGKVCVFSGAHPFLQIWSHTYIDDNLAALEF